MVTLVFCRFLEKWIYEGSLDDAYEEFLIQKRPQFSLCQNRYYWTKTFFVESTAVPSFLTGMESSILECGRAVNLLRLCCPKVFQTSVVKMLLFILYFHLIILINFN